VAKRGRDRIVIRTAPLAEQIGQPENCKVVSRIAPLRICTTSATARLFRPILENRFAVPFASAVGVVEFRLSGGTDNDMRLAIGLFDQINQRLRETGVAFFKIIDILRAIDPGQMKNDIRFLDVFYEIGLRRVKVILMNKDIIPAQQVGTKIFPKKTDGTGDKNIFHDDVFPFRLSTGSSS